MACESKPGPSASAVPPKPKEVLAFEVLDFDGKAPPNVKVDGEIQGGLQWRDETGENLIIFSRKSVVVSEPEDGPGEITTTMKANHIISKSGIWEKVREYRELVELCEWETRADVYVDPGAWSIKDINQDGIVEATWVWYSDCSHENSPSKKKVMMTIRDQKYPLRGKTDYLIDNHIEYGGYKADPAFGAIEPEFLEHAKRIWDDTGNPPWGMWKD